MVCTYCLTSSFYLIFHFSLRKYYSYAEEADFNLDSVLCLWWYRDVPSENFKAHKLFRNRAQWDFREKNHKGHKPVLVRLYINYEFMNGNFYLQSWSRLVALMTPASLSNVKPPAGQDFGTGPTIISSIYVIYIQERVKISTQAAAGDVWILGVNCVDSSVHLKS